MFEDKKPLSTFLIGMAAGIFMLMIAIAAIAGAEPPLTQATLGTVNLIAGIVAGIFLLLGLVIALPIIKEDKAARIEIVIFLLIAFIFMIAFAIVSAL